MPRSCSVCDLDHKTRKNIEKSMLSGRSLAAISREYSGELSEAALSNHKSHISRQMTCAVSITTRLSAEKLLDDIFDIIQKAQSILENSNKDGIKLQSIRTLQGIYSMLGNWRIEQAKLNMAKDQADKENGIIELPTIDPNMTAIEAADIYRRYIRTLKTYPTASVVLLPQKEILTHRENNNPVDDEQARRQARREARRLRLEQQNNQPEMEVDQSAIEEAEENKRLEEEINSILEWQPSPDHNSKRNQQPAINSRRAINRALGN